MSVRRLRCHRCGSTDLTVAEVCHEHGSFSSIVVTEDGQLAALDEAVFSAGDIQPKLTRVHCHDCGHNWHPRRNFAGHITEDEATR